MKIKKEFQSGLPAGSVLNTDSNSQTSTFSCDYIKGLTGIVIYNNASGSNTSVTLNESLANFSCVEIIYHSNDGAGYKNSTGKIWHPNNTNITMTFWYHLGNTIYCKYTNASLSNSTITLTDSIQFYLQADGYHEEPASYVYIECVIGYR